MDQAPAIRIARIGAFTSNEGVSVSFAAADLAAAAEAYDPEADPAPLVIGHPRLDDPAYGWVSGLAVQDGALIATPDKIEPSFAEMVRDGRFPKVSARFYPPSHPANPKPGVWYLKHVGFLGAHAPGIKGLGTVQFADDDDGGIGSVTIDFAEPSDVSTAAQEARMGDEELAARASALDAREAELKVREEAETARAKAARHGEHVSFAEGLVAEARLAPAGRELVVGLLDHFDTEALVSFGEAGGLSPAAALRKLLDGAQPLVDLGERGGKPEGEKAYVSFAAPDGYEVDPAQADLHAKAMRIQQGNSELAWIDCVKRAQQGA